MPETVKYDDLDFIAGLIAKAHEAGASDIHFMVGKPPTVSLHGRLVPFMGLPPMSEIDCDLIRRGTGITDHKETILADTRHVDYSRDFSGQGVPVRVRINGVYQQGSLTWTFRLIPVGIPDPSALGIPDVVQKISNDNWGLVLVTGPMGSGKSTTLASILNKINMADEKKIVVIEDAIEFIHRADAPGFVLQREVGTDSASYEDSLKDALRQRLNIVQIGEIRTPDVLQLTLDLAWRGLMVLATFHAPRALVALDRIIHMLPGQEDSVRTQLHHVLRGIVAQKLYPILDDDGQTPTGYALATEVLSMTTQEVRNLVRDGKFQQIEEIMKAGSHDCRSLNKARAELVMKGLRIPEEKDLDIVI